MKPITHALSEHLEKGLPYPIITAHSGCEGTPDNSLAHVKTAIESGADAFEIDIHMGENNTLILSHDIPTGSESIPTLAEAFRLAAEHPSICINCDVKEENIKLPVLTLAKEYGLVSRIVFTGSYNMEEIRDIAHSDADWWINVWNASDKEVDSAFARYAELSNVYRVFNIHHGMLTPEYAARASAAGYSFSVWTVNDEDTLRRMMACPCVCNITTRIPRLALAIRKEIFGI